MESVPQTHAPPDCFDSDNIDEGSTKFGLHSRDSNMERLDRRTYGNNTNATKNVREGFMSYFVNEGQVPWQRNFIS